jgi:hypothetical protein
LYQSRARGMADIRAIYITTCLTLVLMGSISEQYKWNCDCSTYIVKAEDTANKVVVFRGPGDKRQVMYLYYYFFYI